MAKITFVLGLCGSGKSHYCKQLNKEKNVEILESVLSDAALATIERHLRARRNCVIEEISFCFEQNRKVINSFLSAIPDVEIEWVCFENDLESANWNVTHRTNKGDPEGHLRINDFVSPRYTFPKGGKIIPITRIAKRRKEREKRG